MLSINMKNYPDSMRYTVRQWDTQSLTRAPPMLVCKCKYLDEMAWLSCWPPRGQQVLHQRWIREIRCMQAMKHTCKGIHPGFETQGRHHQRSKTGVSVAPQKKLMDSVRLLGTSLNIKDLEYDIHDFPSSWTSFPYSQNDHLLNRGHLVTDGTG